MGKEVETLFEGQRLPGKYLLEWDAKNYSSGVYFYNIEAGNFILTKKMILIK